MIPVSYQLIRAIHEERIRASQIRRPDWVYEEALMARVRKQPRAMPHIRLSIAEALRRLASSLEGQSAREEAAQSS